MRSFLSQSTVCSQLVHLRVFEFSDKLKALVYQRAKQGRPLRMVEVNYLFWDAVYRSTRRETKREMERFGPYVDEGDSDYFNVGKEDGDTGDSINDGSDEDDRMFDPPGS